MTIVAIDGPAAAGKSSVARAAARRLGYRYLDTGAMYRALALAALERGIDAGDARALERLAESLTVSVANDRVLVDGSDVTDRLRARDVTRTVSAVSAHAGVRRSMLRRQRDLIESGRVVVEGRDIGAAVAPDAPVKIFLTADLGERARRRVRQLALPQDRSTLAGVERAISARDEADAGREASPLSRTPDAVVIDSTGKDLEAVVDEVVAVVRKALHGG